MLNETFPKYINHLHYPLTVILLFIRQNTIDVIIQIV